MDPIPARKKDHLVHKDLLADDDDLVLQIERDFRLARDYTEGWREEVKELYDLVAGDQWDDLSRARMLDTLRPMVTFNITVKYLDAVGGLEVGNRREVQYFPREVGDSNVSELYTNAAKWVRDECDADDEESEAFWDLLLGGMGWTETEVSDDMRPEGDVVIERRDPLEMFWDPASRKRNLKDCRWMMRVRPMTLEEIEERWPGKTIDMPQRGVGTTLGIDVEELYSDALHDAQNAWRYMGDSEKTRRAAGMVAYVDYRWWVRETHFRVRTQFGERTFTRSQWTTARRMLEANGIPYEAAEYRRRRYYRAQMAGKTILDKGPNPYRDGFAFNVMTGRRDRNSNTWFGIGRVLKDPQLWINKFFSSILHTINSQAKGGVIAKREAFENPSKAENTWARPDSITWADELHDEHGKPNILPKPQADYPEGMDRLMTFTVQSLPEISGLNLELLGLASKVQPGVLEAQRKEAGMTMLGWAFDSKRRYTKDAGRTLAYYIREYIADGRLVRIDQENGPKFVKLMKDELTLDYDIITDESPSSPNAKERIWGMMMQMIPHLISANIPVPPEVLDYSPLPRKLVDAWKKMISEPNPEQQKQSKLAEAAATADVKKTEAEAQKLEAEVEETQAETILDLAKAREAAARAGKSMGGG